MALWMIIIPKLKRDRSVKIVTIFSDDRDFDQFNIPKGNELKGPEFQYRGALTLTNHP